MKPTTAAAFAFVSLIHKFINSTSTNCFRFIKIKKYYNCIFSIECNLRKHGAVTNQFPSILFQRQENWLRNWIGWPAVWRKRQAKPTKKINFINLICWWRQLERPQFSLIQSKEIWLIEENWLPPCFLCLPSSINKEKIFHLLIGLPGGEEKKSIKWSCLHSFKRMPLHWLTFLPSAVFDFIPNSFFSIQEEGLIGLFAGGAHNPLSSSKTANPINPKERQALREDRRRLL